jgi:hypothetical protein
LGKGDSQLSDSKAAAISHVTSLPAHRFGYTFVIVRVSSTTDQGPKFGFEFVTLNLGA